ncbi:MAG: hypothetical protein SGI77_00030 [Pirellulaceae bacterium]|nr:hypothetical protein [Pirellulaceae bacterium]
MLKLPFVLLYTAMTFLAWGVYGILLHQGQEDMGHSYLKPFVGVGIAYFLIAVLGAGAMLGGRKEKGFWSFTGTLLSLAAGSVGALGALGVILALAFGGSPIYVMPLVFGGAPVVNTLVTSWIGNTFNKITPLFVIGMVLVGVGMAGVLAYKPKSPKKTEATTSLKIESIAGQSELLLADASNAKASDEDGKKSSDEKPGGFVSILLSIALAIFCWGAYGPVLHLGQMKMGGSRLRPFCCVGLAYFAIAVAAPLALLSFDQGEWTVPGMFWSIAAGTAGAIGALGIILAFNSGGKPVFVMPLVFGFAPVINTLTTMWLQSQLDKINPVFIGALATGICGAVMVLVFAPKATHGPSPKAETFPDNPPAIEPSSAQLYDNLPSAPSAFKPNEPST